ncbi:unnamed protein product [Ophioblennius macclurei]
MGVIKYARYLLFIFVVIFWLLGLLVLAVGLWLRFDPEIVALLSGDEDPPSIFFINVYILLGGGGFVMIVWFFGWFGAVRESQCLLGLFFACLMIIFMEEIAAAAFGFLNRDQISEEVQMIYMRSITEVDNSNGTADIFHQILNCCGGSSSEAAAALCEGAAEDTQDCLTAISDFFDQKLLIIGSVGLGTAVVMIIGMVISGLLCCAIRYSRVVI